MPRTAPRPPSQTIHPMTRTAIRRAAFAPYRAPEGHPGGPTQAVTRRRLGRPPDWVDPPTGDPSQHRSGERFEAAALGGSIITNWWGSRSSKREEWFRRVQWAAAMATSPDPATSAAGLAVLDELATSKLANDDDLAVLQALNANTAVDEFEQNYAQIVDETTFIADDEQDEGGQS